MRYVVKPVIGCLSQLGIEEYAQTDILVAESIRHTHCYFRNCRADDFLVCRGDVVHTVLVMILHISGDGVAIVRVLLSVRIGRVGDLPDTNEAVVVVHADGLADEPSGTNVIHGVAVGIIETYIHDLCLVVRQVEGSGPVEIFLGNVVGSNLQL